jgi:hypothetical protein
VGVGDGASWSGGNHEVAGILSEIIRGIAAHDVDLDSVVDNIRHFIGAALKIEGVFNESRLLKFMGTAGVSVVLGSWTSWAIRAGKDLSSRASETLCGISRTATRSDRDVIPNSAATRGVGPQDVAREDSRQAKNCRVLHSYSKP